MLRIIITAVIFFFVYRFLARLFPQRESGSRGWSSRTSGRARPGGERSGGTAEAGPHTHVPRRDARDAEFTDLDPS